MGAINHNHRLYFFLENYFMYISNQLMYFRDEDFQSSSKIPILCRYSISGTTGHSSPKSLRGSLGSFSWFLSGRVVWQFIEGNIPRQLHSVHGLSLEWPTRSLAILTSYFLYFRCIPIFFCNFFPLVFSLTFERLQCCNA